MIRDSPTGYRNDAWDQIFVDLLIVVAYTLLTYAVILYSVAGDSLSTLVGTGFILFVPGYAFIAALFPERPNDSTHSRGWNIGPDRGRIDWLERMALSFVGSILIVTVLSFLLDVSQVGIEPEPLVRGLSLFVVVASTVGAVRRMALPPNQRFMLPIRSWIARTRAAIRSPEDPLSMAMYLVVICALLVGLISAGYAVSVPQSGESFTEFSVLTEDDDGDLVAGQYPTDAVEGEQRNLVVEISNQERRPENYSFLVRLQRIDPDDSSVLEEQTIAARQVGPLTHNETEYQRIEFAPEVTGEQARLQFLLFKGPVPDTPSADDAYRDLHIWLSVTSAET